MDALIRAAEEQEEVGNYRAAYGFWKELISRYGSYVSKDQYDLWKSHMDRCDRLM